MKTIRSNLILILCIILLCGCSNINIETVDKPLITDDVDPTPSARAVPTAELQAQPTPIKTTQPVNVDQVQNSAESTKQPNTYIGMLEVRAGDTLEKDIIPQLCTIFSLNDNDVKKALEDCPQSKLINDKLKDYRRMEGILFPGKFEIENSGIEDAIVQWVALAEARYEQLLTKCSDLNDLEPQEQLSLAAVIEWECLPNDYYSKVAAVFLNRLHDGSKMRSCATTEYALGYERPYLTRNDIKIESSYNTYHVKGVPIGPICVVDDECFLAAMQKTTNKKIYYFFNDYALKEMFFFEDYDEFKKAGVESRELYDQTFDIDPFDKMDKKAVFGYPQ